LARGADPLRRLSELPRKKTSYIPLSREKKNPTPPKIC
jgi:hypothetical protein